MHKEQGSELFETISSTIRFVCDSDLLISDHKASQPSAGSLLDSYGSRSDNEESVM